MPPFHLICIDLKLFLSSGFMYGMKHVYCCTVQPSKEIQRRSALVSCERWEIGFAFPSSQNIPEPWDPLQKYDGFACSFIMMSFWACNNSAPARHNNNTHTHTVTLFNFQFILLFASGTAPVWCSVIWKHSQQAGSKAAGSGISDALCSLAGRASLMSS